MATLYVTEYAEDGHGPSGSTRFAVAEAPGLAGQTITISGSSTQSAAFNANTRLIRVHTDAICSLAMGTNPTATTAMKRMAADQTEYWGVVPGDKIAVIANT